MLIQDTVRDIVKLVFVLLMYHVSSGNTIKRKHKTDAASNQTEVIERLSKFFGIDNVPGRVFHHKAPPQYMLELYNSMTELGGLMKRAGPYRADVIRSFPDRRKCSNFIFFGTSAPLRNYVYTTHTNNNPNCCNNSCYTLDVLIVLIFMNQNITKTKAVGFPGTKKVLLYCTSILVSFNTSFG